MDWTVFWWLGWVFAIFLPIELYAALRKQPGGTFSETVWRWFGVRTNRPVPLGMVRRGILACFLESLTLHLVGGGDGTWIPVAVFGAGVGAIIGYAMVFERDVQNKERKR